MTPTENTRNLLGLFDLLKGATDEQIRQFDSAVKHASKAAVEAEREECAKVAENAENLSGGVYGGPSRCEYGCGVVIAAAIRARKEKA